MPAIKDWRENVSFVLVEPKEPGNIGTSARAIKNMGFRNLRLVRPPELVRQADEARRLAHGSLDVLESAAAFDGFTDAIRDSSLVVGTTRRAGRGRGLFMGFEEGMKKTASVAKANRVAIVFGREDRGLLNEEAGECAFLVTIPASKGQPSLNLSHAVLIAAYELSRAAKKSEKASEKEKSALVGHGELDALFDRASRALKMLDYIPRGDRDLEKKMMSNIKHLIGRSGLTDWELKMLHGICAQAEKKLGRGR
jgi:TrmH family RNA methyltransferase